VVSEINHISPTPIHLLGPRVHRNAEQNRDAAGTHAPSLAHLLAARMRVAHPVYKLLHQRRRRVWGLYTVHGRVGVAFATDPNYSLHYPSLQARGLQSSIDESYRSGGLRKQMM
jgi:hypothetical protein